MISSLNTCYLTVKQAIFLTLEDLDPEGLVVVLPAEVLGDAAVLPAGVDVGEVAVGRGAAAVAQPGAVAPHARRNHPAVGVGVEVEEVVAVVLD